MEGRKKLEDVFKLSGAPVLTFVEPKEYNRLLVALRTLGRGVVIEGPSGIGKTTSVLNVLESLGVRDEVKILSGRKKKDLVKIRGILTEDDFGTVIIDDFHKLDGDLKRELSDLLKTLADEESLNSKLVLVGINKTGHSLIEYSSDLRNRIEIIKFESNSEEKIDELITKGESHLKISITAKSDIVADSQGSFHLAQMLAHNACLRCGIFEECDTPTTVDISFEVLKEYILDDLAVSFYNTTVSFCKGQKIKKGSRAPYLHVLYWLSLSDNMSINIESELISRPANRNSVNQILTKGHLKGHFDKVDKYSEIMFYNDDTTEISIEDPKYFYYIKNISWVSLARKIGYHTIDFSTAYDYALSFSGKERQYAEYIFDKLSESEVSVFYDNNEQSRILSKEVEEYLAPIYRSESRFIIPIISKDYPNRVWCKFEGESFKHRFGEDCVIPLWLSSSPPGMFDASNGKGGFMINEESDIYDQLDNFIALLITKINEVRLEESV